MIDTKKKVDWDSICPNEIYNTSTIGVYSAYKTLFHWIDVLAIYTINHLSSTQFTASILKKMEQKGSL